MKKISKTVAYEVARKMTQKTIGNTIKQTKKELSDLVKNEYLKQLPQSIIEMFLNVETKPYLKVTNDITVLPKGRKDDVKVYLQENVPSKRCDHSASYIEVEDSFFDLITKKEWAIKDLEKEQNTLTDVISESLFKLASLKRIKEQFPEAVQYLPQYLLADSEVPAIPIEKIRASLKFYEHPSAPEQTVVKEA